MNPLDTNLFFAILGAFTGALLSPALEAAFRKWNKDIEEEEIFSVKNGLIILCAANAFWALSFLLGHYAVAYGIERASPVASVALYSIAAFLFILSAVQFKKTKTIPSWSSVRVSLICLVIGNLVWLISDLTEVLRLPNEVRSYGLIFGVLVLLTPFFFWWRDRHA